MTPYAILFDFDGTLFYGTTDINFHALNAALADMGQPPINWETANSTVGDKLHDACQRILTARGTVADEGQVDTLLKGLMHHAPAAIEQYAVIEPECVHMLQTLSQRVPIAICSNAEQSYLDALTKKFDIHKYFTHIWHRKPGYCKKDAIPVLKEMLQAQQVIMVGDREEDVSSGKANGCITVALQNDFGARDALGGDYDVLSHREMEQVLLSLIEQ